MSARSYHFYSYGIGAVANGQLPSHADRSTGHETDTIRYNNSIIVELSTDSWFDLADRTH
jgi:hypothetical protein